MAVTDALDLPALAVCRQLAELLLAVSRERDRPWDGRDYAGTIGELTVLAAAIVPLRQLFRNSSAASAVNGRAYR